MLHTAVVLVRFGNRQTEKMNQVMSSAEYEELYLASVRVPLVLAIFLGLWGLVILVLQALQIDFSSVLRKASSELAVNVSLLRYTSYSYNIRMYGKKQVDQPPAQSTGVSRMIRHTRFFGVYGPQCVHLLQGCCRLCALLDHAITCILYLTGCLSCCVSPLSWSHPPGLSFCFCTLLQAV